MTQHHREQADRMWSPECEAGVLGGLLLDNGAWDRVGDMLTAQDFNDQRHGRIWTAVAALTAAGKPADVITVHDHLKAHGQDGGGIAYLHQIAQYVPSAGSMRRWAEIVRDHRQGRDLMAAAGDIADLAQRRDLPAAQRQEAAQGRIAKLMHDAPRDEWVGAYEGMVQHTQVLEDRAEGRIVAFPTGLADLDEQFDGGLRPGQLVIVGARPAMGKSAFALTVAAHMAEAQAVGLLSLEMSHTDIRDRLTALLGRVDLGHVLRPSKGTGLDWERVTDGVEKAKHLNLFISDQPGLTIEAVRMKARMLKRMHGLSVLIVDYLGLMPGTDPKLIRAYQLAEITGGLKRLAKELGIVVVALAQVNRRAEERTDPMPGLVDLRDSGSIEQDADVVMFLHRPIAAKPDLGDEWTDYAKVRVSKVRQGRIGDVHLRYVGSQTRFEDWTGPVPTRAAARSRGSDL